MARGFGPKRTSVSAGRKMRRKAELDEAILSYLKGNLLGSSPAIIRYYVARHIMGMSHHDHLPHQSVTASIKRLHKHGKIRVAMGDGWVIDPDGSVGHMAHAHHRR